MDNQQGNKCVSMLMENIPSDLKISNFYKGSVEEFVNNIHEDYEILQKRYNMTRDQLKRAKKVVYDIYEKNVPIGYKEIPEYEKWCASIDGIIINKRHRFVITPHPNYKGYNHVCLKNKSTKSVHRLVAKTFIPNPDNLPQVNHKDGNKNNNSVSNLEWCDNSTNVKHAFDNGLIDKEKIRKNQTGETNSAAKITEKCALAIHDMKDQFSRRELADFFGVSTGTINDILAKRSWKHI